MGIFNMPKAMKQLAVVQLFTWFSLFAMWIYSTNAITSNIYNMHVGTGVFAKIEQQVRTASSSGRVGATLFVSRRSFGSTPAGAWRVCVVRLIVACPSPWLKGASQ